MKTAKRESTADYRRLERERKARNRAKEAGKILEVNLRVPASRADEIKALARSWRDNPLGQVPEIIDIPAPDHANIKTGQVPGITLPSALRDALTAKGQPAGPALDAGVIDALLGLCDRLGILGLDPSADQVPPAMIELFGGRAVLDRVAAHRRVKLAPDKPVKSAAKKTKVPPPAVDDDQDLSQITLFGPTPDQPVPTVPNQIEPISTHETSITPAPIPPTEADQIKPKTVPLGKRIKSAREAAGLSQKKLAGLAEVSPSLPGHWETGRRTPAPDIMQKLVDILGIEP